MIPLLCALDPGWPVTLLCLTGVDHRQLVDLAQKHFGSVSGTYTEDAVPTLSPCRFTGSQVGCLRGRGSALGWGLWEDPLVCGYLHDSREASGRGPRAAASKHMCSHLHAHTLPTPSAFLVVPQPCHILFQICHRDDALPLAHVAIAVEGPGWANPDNVALQVANAIIGHYDCTYSGGVVSARVDFRPCLQRKEGSGIVLLHCGAHGVGRRQKGGC